MPPAHHPSTRPVLDAETGAPESQISKFGNLQTVGISADLSAWTPAQHAASILADVKTFESHSRIAAFVALRIGLRLVWVRDNGSHGDIGKFIVGHLGGMSRSSLANYMNVASRFVLDAKLVDKKTHLLSDGGAVAPILNEQLELFADPEAVFEGALKKVVKWVADRGLSQIYKDIAAEGKRPAPPAGGNKQKLTESERRAQNTKDAEALLAQFSTWYESGTWKLLDDKQLDQLRALGAKFHLEAPAIVKGRNKTPAR
jgi:hypothetical protein